jgi:hypothetical protein
MNSYVHKSYLSCNGVTSSVHWDCRRDVIIWYTGNSPVVFWVVFCTTILNWEISNLLYKASTSAAKEQSRKEFGTANRDSSLGTTADYGLDGPNSINQHLKIFVSSTRCRQILGPTQPHIQWVPGTLVPGVKRTAREADHSPPSSAQIKKGGAITPAPHMWC